MKVRVSWAIRKRGVSFVLVCLYRVLRIARLWSNLPPCEPVKSIIVLGLFLGGGYLKHAFS